MTKTIEFDVTGMTCDHCVRAVTSAIEDVPGVLNARVSLDENKATVDIDNADTAAIEAAIREEGYEAAAR